MTSPLQGFVNAIDQIRNIERLGDEISRSILASLFNILRGAVSGDNNDLNIGIIFLDLL
jgi:hypothetical protein